MHTSFRRFFGMILVVGMAGGLLAGPGIAQAGGFVSPQDMLTVYFQAINAGDYALAYNQWIAPRQTYTEFVTGYGDTARVEAHFGHYQPGPAGTTQGAVPAVLVGYRTDGSVAAYNGCYYLNYDGTSSGIGLWRIADGQMQPMAAVPNGPTLPTYLDRACYAPANEPGFITAQEMLAAYYAAINAGDYAAAYSLWTNPLQSYTDFATGFADTRQVVMFTGALQPSASTSYPEVGRVPVVLLGFHTDGGAVAYAGCFRLDYHSARPFEWGILGANLAEISLPVGPDGNARMTNALWAQCF
ncbi:MAG: hypothetical protein GYB65_19565 [Chloroflexi bacterium]|nr:hypothetical protein [Chloroflexota bacterium]